MFKLVQFVNDDFTVIKMAKNTNYKFKQLFYNKDFSIKIKKPLNNCFANTKTRKTIRFIFI